MEVTNPAKHVVVDDNLNVTVSSDKVVINPSAKGKEEKVADSEVNVPSKITIAAVEEANDGNDDEVEAEEKKKKKKKKKIMKKNATNILVVSKKRKDIESARPDIGVDTKKKRSKKSFGQATPDTPADEEARVENPADDAGASGFVPKEPAFVQTIGKLMR